MEILQNNLSRGREPKKRVQGEKIVFSPIGIDILTEGKEILKENHQGFPLRSESGGLNDKDASP